MLNLCVGINNGEKQKIELMFCDKIFTIDAARIGRTVVVRDGLISKEIDMLGFKEFFQTHFDDINDEAICAWHLRAVGAEVLTIGEVG